MPIVRRFLTDLASAGARRWTRRGWRVRPVPCLAIARRGAAAGNDERAHPQVCRGPGHVPRAVIRRGS
jgi:hypothetical protein